MVEHVVHRREHRRIADGLIAEHGMADRHGTLGLRDAMDPRRQVEREGALGGPALGVGGLLGLEGLDLGAVHDREQPQQLADLRVRPVDEELVERVRRGPGRVEPDGRADRRSCRTSRRSGRAASG